MSAHLVSGGDSESRGRQVRALIDELVGGDDRSLAVEEHDVPVDGDGDDRARVVADVVAAASSPPFGTAVRVVVVREVQALLAADVGTLVSYLEAPLETTELVLVASGGRVASALTKALKAAGGETIAVKGGATRDRLQQASKDVGIRLSGEARARIEAHLGDDASRVTELVEVLRSAAGDDAEELDLDAVEPYLAEPGTVKPWDLTNAIDAGDVAGAVTVLRRVLSASGGTQAKPMHPLQVMGMLHNHVRRGLRLDDPTITGEQDAVEALTELTGRAVKGYPARKALQQSRKLGSDGMRRAVELLGRADLELRGSSALPPEVVLEVLVARLAGLGGPGRSGRARRGAPV